MYNYSARRKQGLGSLRPGYSFGGPTSFLIGNLLNWGLPKVIDYATKSKEQREEEAYKKTMQRMGITPYFPDNNNDDEEKKGTIPSSGWKGGLINLLATAFLGPLIGPLALTVGKGLMNKSKGLGFTGGEEGSEPGPKGLGPKTDWYTGSDEEDKDEENRITTPTTSVPTHIGPSNGDSGGGSDGWSGGAETRDSSGWESSPFFKGGRVSYSKGGLASLWQRQYKY